jgi:hypothetical protein
MVRLVSDFDRLTMLLDAPGSLSDEEVQRRLQQHLT